MTIDNLPLENESFWGYLNHKLRIEFRNNQLNDRLFIYPIEISVNSISQKTKTNVPTLINAKIVFTVEECREKEYVAKLSLGNNSRKVYINTKGADLTKCFPKSKPFTDWIKIDEENREIKIFLS